MPMFIASSANARDLIALVLVMASVVGVAARAEDDVAGELILLTGTTAAPNGAWSWFSSERAIVDTDVPGGPRILVSSVSAAPDGDAESGDVDVHWYDVGSGRQGSYELHDRLERDDHDNAALLLRPDGRYLAVYSRHGSDHLTRYRITVRPHDPTEWQPEMTVDNGAGTTYSNVHHLQRDNDGVGRTYNFTRTKNWDPNVLISKDAGGTWASAGKLLTEGDRSARPYVRYASSDQRIHFITTEQHPRNFDNSIYHGYVQNGRLFASSGETVDANIFDAQAAKPADLTAVFRTGESVGSTVMRRAWTIDVAIDGDGRPVIVFQTRANDDANDHRFFYGRFDGQQWHIHQVAKAGGYLYETEQDYTGLVAIDPSSPQTLYLSTNVDPRDGSVLEHYEIFRAVAEDGGANRRFSAITWDSTMDNLRPIVPSGDDQRTVLLWMRGTYESYRQWDTQVVGLVRPSTLENRRAPTLRFGRSHKRSGPIEH